MIKNSKNFQRFAYNDLVRDDCGDLYRIITAPEFYDDDQDHYNGYDYDAVEIYKDGSEGYRYNDIPAEVLHKARISKAFMSKILAYRKKNSYYKD